MTANDHDEVPEVPDGSEAPAVNPEAEVQSEDEVAQDPLVAAQRERDEYLDMVKRVQADFENYKKRMVRQQTETLERAAEGLVVTLLPVLDAFDLAQAHLESEPDAGGKDLLQAAALLSETLAKVGLERVGAPGDAFDPMLHEAVEHQPAGEDDDEVERGPVVVDVLRAGYRFKGRVVRPAMVRVRG